MEAKAALLANHPFFTGKDINLWRLFGAPGRINLIGEHTDYNLGYVMPAAIGQRIYLAIRFRKDAHIRLSALDLSETFETDLSGIQPLAGGHWANYLLGPIAQLMQHGISVPGFEAAIWSTLPVGAGLSSSAAVEVAILTALNQMMELGFSKLQLAQMAQAAEHAFAGVQCGIMDMYASLMGRADQFIQLDCRSLEHAYRPFVAADYSLVLFDTGVKHALASSAYNQRRLECEQAVGRLQQAGFPVASLRDATMPMLEEAVATVNPIAFKRAAFVVQENARVIQAAACLEAGDWPGLGKCLWASHDGLQHAYEVSCAEADHMVDHLRHLHGVAGARMMGGGFGGCVLALIQQQQLAVVQQMICQSYQQTFGRLPEIYPVSPAEGAGEIS